MTELSIFNVSGKWMLRVKKKDGSEKEIRDCSRILQDFKGSKHAIVEFLSGEQFFMNEEGEIVKRGYSSITSCQKHGIPYYVVTTYSKADGRYYFGVLDMELNIVLKSRYTSVKMLDRGLCIYDEFRKNNGPVAVIPKNSKKIEFYGNMQACYN